LLQYRYFLHKDVWAGKLVLRHDDGLMLFALHRLQLCPPVLKCQLFTPYMLTFFITEVYYQKFINFIQNLQIY